MIKLTAENAEKLIENGKKHKPRVRFTGDGNSHRKALKRGRKKGKDLPLELASLFIQSLQLGNERNKINMSHEKSEIKSQSTIHHVLTAKGAKPHNRKPWKGVGTNPTEGRLFKTWVRNAPQPDELTHVPAKPTCSCLAPLASRLVILFALRERFSHEGAVYRFAPD